MHSTTALLALLAALIFSSDAWASKMYIREYSRLGTQQQGDDPQVAREPGLDQTPIDFTGGSVSSVAFNVNTRFIRIICDASCSYSVTNPAGSATTNNAYLPANVIEYIGVPQGAGYFINVNHNP